MSFFDSLLKYNNKICIIEDNDKFTYKEFINLSDKLASKINKRSLVFLITGNNIETLATYVGLIREKSVVVLLEKNIKNEFLEILISKYKPNYIVQPKTSTLPNGYKEFFNFKKYIYAKKTLNKKILMNDKLALLLTTSGTTGSPKLVRLSYNNYIHNSKDIISSLELKNKSVITTLPMNYTYGSSIINTHLISGGKIILNNNSILEKKFWDKFKKYQPNCFYGVPYIFEIIDKLNFKQFYHKNFKFIANAGGKLDERLLKKLINFTEKKEIKFYSMYGQTEASPRMSVLNHKDLKKKFNSIGKAINKNYFYIIDQKGKEIRCPYTDGELVYKGKNVCMGYSNSLRDLKKEDENNNILFTGDLARYDKDKFFYIVGRIKRIIKIFGVRINLEDVEYFLKKMGFDAKCMINDDKLIIQHDKKNLDINNLKDKLSKKLNLNKKYINFKYFNKISNNKVLN